ncbi:MAG: peptide chain release factor 2 [Bacilli bacterium]|jgi:peptide chain release factor 2|nr:peptide chain release factor 2 [Bacilli bacterium]
MDIFELKNNIQKIEDELTNIINIDNIHNLSENKVNLEKVMLEDGFYNNQKKVNEVTNKLSSINKILDLYEVVTKQIKDFNELLELNIDDLLQLKDDINNDYSLLEDNVNQLKILSLLNDKYDDCDALVEIHMGAGGTESQDWVDMLYKMYINYAKKKGFGISIVDASYASDVGIKSIMFKLKGSYAYGLLKNERGVHRLIRISPFDSNKRRHTTFALVSVSPILEEVKDIEINDKDLVIDTYRSTGAGGQSVNTTDSAVRITHVPTKIVVTCQNERSQLQNKEEALRVLKSKLLQLELDKQNELKRNLRGENIDINFGSQIRSYIFHPYQMVKDHRSKYESSNPQSLLDGNLEDVIASVLQYSKER